MPKDGHFKPLLIQSDDRGRILLPKELRKHRLFEIEQSATDSGTYQLHVLTTSRLKSPSSSVWTPSEARNFFIEQLLPAIAKRAFEVEQLNVYALILYGSYARDEAFNTSDLDICLMCDRVPVSKERRKIESELDDAFSDQLEELKRHKINTEVSWIFMTPELPKQNLPTLAYSIAVDGICIAEQDSQWTHWQSKILKMIQQQKAKRVRRGSEWIWQQ